MKLENKTALITGASYGLGKTIAYHLFKQGVEVILLARSGDKLEEICNDIKDKGGKAHYYTLDLLSLDETISTIEKVKTEHGAPDILVNNATLGHWKFVEESDYEDFDIHMGVAFLGTARMTRGFIHEMLEKPEATVVNIVSGGDKARWPGAAAYLASKAAVTAFTEAFRMEMWGTKVNVMLFSAGKIGDTNYFKTHADSEERIPTFAKLIPTITSAKAAKAIVKGIRKDKRLVVVPLMMKVTYFFHRLFPRTMNWLIGRTGVKRRDVLT